MDYSVINYPATLSREGMGFGGRGGQRQGGLAVRAKRFSSHPPNLHPVTGRLSCIDSSPFQAWGEGEPPSEFTD